MKTAKLFYRASLLLAHTDCTAGFLAGETGRKKRGRQKRNAKKRVAVRFQSFQMARSSAFVETRSRR
jgi:hypothetical protein